MNTHTGRHALGNGLIALAAWLPALVPAAEDAGTRPLLSPFMAESDLDPAFGLDEMPDEELDEELDEVLVEGLKPIRNRRMVREWLPRLAGRFIVEGSVDLHGNAGSEDLLAVRGSSDCVHFLRSAVQCELNLRWPETRGPQGEEILGGVSSLSPAIVMYSSYNDSRSFGISYMLVDSNGIAEEALGYLLTEDMLVSRNKCVNVAGNCERVVRITADAELKQVEMRIDLEVDYRKAASFRFVMQRVPQ